MTKKVTNLAASVRQRLTNLARQPVLSITALVRRLKGATRRLLRLGRPDIAQRFWKGGLWSPFYVATSCGSTPIAVIRQYIEQQNSPED